MATVFYKDNQIFVVMGFKKGESVKNYFGDFVKYLKEKHGLIVEEKTANHRIVLNDMSATNNYYLGRENIIVVGEAGGFLCSAKE